ncbi:MAG: beta-glucosidase BglX, partial [Acidobacteriota bacterium]|nr:beta-glucosidase BglX [Acidobacteriota bacterium]
MQDRTVRSLIASVLCTCVVALPLAAGDLIDPEIESRIDILLEKMTLAEKIGQLNQYSASFDLTGPPPDGERERKRYDLLLNGGVGSMLNVNGVEATLATQKLVVENSRLGIPLIFGYDVIHGYQTMFPVPLAEAASWDLKAVERAARLAATEASAAGLHWTFAPMVDIARDARWGRIMEGSGEDPYLGSKMAAARVRGFQGNDLGAVDTVAACAKHYAGYGFAEGGRDYNTADFSEQTLRNVILPPFRAAVDAGVATLMNSFNEIGGVPATGSEHLQRTILKGEWDFEGFVVSDWGSIGELVPHGVAAGPRDAARLALTAGSDMDMESDSYSGEIASLVEAGEIDAALIDDAVRRVLRIKFHLGLFEDPYRYSDPEREKEWIQSEEIHQASRDIARKSIVLLQNNGGLLPLDPSAGTIAVIGALASDKDTPLGSWRGQAIANSAISLLEGIEAAVSDDVEVRYASGAELGIGERTFIREVALNESDRSGFAEAVETARGSDVVVLALGEEAFQTGEGRSQVGIGLKGVQNELLREVVAVNENVVVVLMNGRPLAIPEVAESVPALVEAWHLGSQAGHAIADVLFGRINPSGKLPVSFPRHVGQEPLYYNAKNTGRPGPSDMVFWSHYTDAPNTPLFAFGHGLSYTSFEVSEPRLSAEAIERDERVSVEVTVTNTGARAGAEVVQLYIRDLVGSTTRPVKELEGFERIEL